MLTTKYIGLNSYAKELVKDATYKESFVLTFGTRNEKISGNKYHIVVNDGNIKEIIYKEIIQDDYKSGEFLNVITYLERTDLMYNNSIKKYNEHICTWIIDPNINESDPSTARYNPF